MMLNLRKITIFVTRGDMDERACGR